MPMSGFSITVVIPAYNVQDYIEEAIDSVLKQERTPDEVIIVNDGSTDKTRYLISKYESYPNFQVIDTENRGLGPARNIGLEAASSEYVYFFDSDDILDSHFIERMHQLINKNKNPDLILFSGESFYDTGYISDFFPDYKRGINEAFTSGKYALNKLAKNNKLFSSACLYMIKKSFMKKNGFCFKPIIHEDEELIFPLISLSGKTVVVDEVFFYRRIRHGSIMQSKKTRKNLEGYFATIDGLINFKKDHPESVEFNKKYWKRRGQSILIATYLNRKNLDFSLKDFRTFLIYRACFYNSNFVLKVIFYSAPLSFQSFLRKQKSKILK